MRALFMLELTPRYKMGGNKVEKRNPVTVAYYPDKVTAEEFVEKILKDTEMLQTFIKNMSHLEGCLGSKTRYPEEWAKVFCAWAELN